MSAVINRHKPKSSLNLMHKLINRELGLPVSGGYNVQSQFYKNIYPNLTMSNVNKLNQFFIRFSSDGKYFITFSRDLYYMYIYRFRGTSNIYSFIAESDYDFREFSLLIGNQAFDIFFSLKSVVCFAVSYQTLSRYFNTFTEDNKYFIVFTSVVHCSQNAVHLHGLYGMQSNSWIDFRYYLEDYTFYIVDIQIGLIVNKLKFRSDKILIHRDYDVKLCNNLLVIVSMEKQIIRLYYIRNGQFEEVKKIYGGHIMGGFNDFFNQCDDMAFRNTLKYKLLHYMYNLTPENRRKCKLTLENFYIYKKLQFWVVQIIDDNLILIKYANENILLSKFDQTHNLKAIFIVYNFNENEIVSVFEVYANNLLDLFEQRYSFYNTRDIKVATFSKYFRIRLNYQYEVNDDDLMDFTIHGLKNRILLKFPLYNYPIISPYVDLKLYNYGAQFSMFKIPTHLEDYAINFFNRDTKEVTFKLEPTPIYFGKNRSIQYIFHPTEPFILSIRRSIIPDFVNVFFYHCDKK